MNSILIFIAGFAFVGYAAYMVVKGSLNPYEANTEFLTKPEIIFYKVLLLAVNNDALIFSKVGLSHVISVSKGLSSGKLKESKSKINETALDFLLINKQNFTVLAAVILQPNTRVTAAKKSQAQFIRKTLKHCNIPLIELPIVKRYDPLLLRSIIHQTIDLVSNKSSSNVSVDLLTESENSGSEVGLDHMDKVSTNPRHETKSLNIGNDSIKQVQGASEEILLTGNANNTIIDFDITDEPEEKTQQVYQLPHTQFTSPECYVPISVADNESSQQK